MSAVAATTLAGRVGTAGRLAGGHAVTAAGGVSDTIEGRKGSSTGWAIIGYALALILLYVLIADSRVVAASSKLVGGAQTAAEAWVRPVDPVTLLGQRFGYTPSAASTGEAAGASSAPSSAPVRGAKSLPGGYVSPFSAKVTPGRTDQGVDFSAPPGSSVLAIGKARIAGIVPNWYKGQPLVYYKLLDGPRKGQYIYAAEQITPTVRVGQVVNAGQPIGRVAASGTGLELGFATSSGATLAQSTTGYVEGQVTAAGDAFRSFLGL